MIRSLRRRHRGTWVALAVALPVLFLFALAVRPDFPVTENLPGAAAESMPASGTDLFPDIALTARLASGPRLSIERPAGRSLPAPDLLLYWSAQGGPSTDNVSLPADAILLGAVTTDRTIFDLPASDSGEVVLFSLGHNTVVTRASLAVASEKATP